MISAVQTAKRNDLKNGLKIAFLGLTLTAVLFGTALGVILGSTSKDFDDVLLSPAFFPLIFGGFVLIAVAWHYARKIDQL